LEIVGPRDHRVKATLLLLLAGCFWRSYPSLATTHAELLVAMARKGSDLVSSGRFGAENMPELTYPLERADAFAHTARARAGSAPPPSLAEIGRASCRERV